jgi:hypothetical protein
MCISLPTNLYNNFAIVTVKNFSVLKVLTFEKLILNLYLGCFENIIFAQYPLIL